MLLRGIDGYLMQAIDEFLAMANREAVAMFGAIAADIRNQAEGEYQY